MSKAYDEDSCGSCVVDPKKTLLTRVAIGPDRRKPALASRIALRIALSKRPYVNPGSFSTAWMKLNVMAPVLVLVLVKAYKETKTNNLMFLVYVDALRHTLKTIIYSRWYLQKLDYHHKH